MTPLLYFAYGSNLRAAQMERLCPGCRFRHPAWLEEYRLAFTLPGEEWQGGVADVISAPAHQVWGALYEITSEHLASLDAYEVYHPQGHPAKNAYLRRAITVAAPDGRSIPEVWCYFVRQPREHVPPSDLYRAALLEGAHERGLPPAYLDVMRAAFDGPTK